MKTLITQTHETEQEIETSIKRDMLLIKTTIAVFGVVLNICFLQLFY